MNYNPVKMLYKLVNEKTLELNITHEGMSSVGIGVIGFSQDQESEIGADVLYPCNKPFIIQYKAAKKGSDNKSATFYINNNKWRNQHQALDAISRSGVCEAYYAFPLVVTGSFLTSNFGNLLNFTCMVAAQKLTGKLNWIGKTHIVEIQKGCKFTVRSEGTMSGEGFSAKEFFKKAKEGESRTTNERNMSEYIRDLLEHIDYAVKKAKIVGQSEHTITLIGIDISEKHLGYLQLPIRVQGLKEEPREKVIFR
jgi:hypothetical protein